MENTNKKPATDWNAYNREYRKRNPDKVAFWRYRQAINLVLRYEKEHPEFKEFREQMLAAVVC